MPERLSKLDRLKRDIIELEDGDVTKVLMWLEAVVDVREEDKVRAMRKAKGEGTE